MKINRNETIVFENADMPFVKKFGQDAAEKMVLDYKFVNATPFIYDTFQLADFLKIARSKMFDMVRNTNRYYRHMLLPKKSGDFRNISAPKFPLNHMQRKILDDILKFVPRPV